MFFCVRFRFWTLWILDYRRRTWDVSLVKKAKYMILNSIISPSECHSQFCFLDCWGADISAKMFQSYQNAEQQHEKISRQFFPSTGLRSVPRNKGLDKILFPWEVQRQEHTFATQVLLASKSRFRAPRQ